MSLYTLHLNILAAIRTLIPKPERVYISPQIAFEIRRREAERFPAAIWPADKPWQWTGYVYGLDWYEDPKLKGDEYRFGAVGDQEPLK